MSIRVMANIWENGPEDRTELLVMLALSDFCDDEGRCYPSMQRIAEKVRMTDRGVRNVVRRLEADGWLSVEIGGGRRAPNRYTVNENPELHSVNDDENPEPHSRNGRENPERHDTKPGTPRHKTRNTVSGEPSRTIKEPSVKEILAEVASPEVVADFIEHRRQMKKPLTTVAAKRMAIRLRASGNADAALSLSIENGWQGVFPEKVAAKQPRQSNGPMPTYKRVLRQMESNGKYHN